jgi:amino acid adenylation domain-containing protein
VIDSEPVRASLAQQGIWFNERLGGIGTVYSMPFAVTFDGSLDVPALIAACDSLVRRHPALASAVREVQGVPFLVAAGVPPRLKVAEHLDEQAEISRPFDLETGPLLRMSLHTGRSGQSRLLVVAHHLVFDGESTSVFLDDLAELYRAESTATAPNLRELAPDGGAGIGAGLSFAREFWKTRYREPAEAALPGLTGPVPMAAVGAAVEFSLPGNLSEALALLSEEIGASRFEIVLASLHTLLHRYGDAEPVIAVDLGTRSEQTRRHVGTFVNELPVSARPDPDWSFRRLIQDQRFAYGLSSDLRGLFRIRDVPLSRAVSAVRPGVSHAPVSLGYRRRAAAPDFHGVAAHIDWALFNHTVRGALRVHIVDGPDRFGVILQYNPQAMNREDAERIGEHWQRLLGAAAADPDASLASLPLLGPEETEALLTTWNDTAVERSAATLSELFAIQARRTPDAIAAVDDQSALTYRELETAVNGLAIRLHEEGIRAGSLVAVCADRSCAMLAGLLAVLRAGAAYLPLDPEHPADRLEFVLSDSRADLLLTTAAMRGRLPARRTLVLEELLPVPGEAQDWPSPDDLAYVIYTSGSTGRPKGVEIPHRALANLVQAMAERVGSRPDDAWLALTSLSFDISALELYLPLVTGGRVVLAADEAIKDGRKLVDLIRERSVSHVQATPSGWRMLLDAGFDAPGVTALAGGEALPASLARQILSASGRLFNVYGPTETTIWSTAAEITLPLEGVPIGAPLANTQVHVLDGRLGLLPAGVAGELYIGGCGVALGYRHRPELTAERFVPDPYGKGLLYRTGDKVRRRSDGQIEFIGRLDDQIKLRGHRIELGEIEAIMLEHRGVRHAAAVVRSDDRQEQRIVAYVVPMTGAEGLREHCARALPAYMIPAEFVALPALPLTANGKLDRAALPEPASRPEPVAPRRAAYTGVAAEVHDIWREVLAVEAVGTDEDLFELGGHSLTITQIASRIRARLGADLPLHIYYDEPTINGIAAAIARVRGKD